MVDQTNREGCATIIGRMAKAAAIPIIAVATMWWVSGKMGPHITEEDRKLANYCQDEAVRKEYGVTQDPRTRMYFYSENRLERLEYYTFMVDCLPDSYFPKKQVEENLENLKSDLRIP